MKKTILRILLFFFFLLIIYFAFIARDTVRLINYFKNTSESRSARVKTIGIEGLCKYKSLDYDENKKSLEQNLKKLLRDREDFLQFYISLEGFNAFRFKKFPYLTVNPQTHKLEKVDYQEKDSDIELFNSLKTDIKNFDNSFKLDSSIEDYKWEVINPPDKPTKNPLNAIYIYHSTDLSQLTALIGLTEAYYPQKDEIADSSVLFSSIIKIYILSSYLNKGQILFNNNNTILETLYVFFDNLINNKYSADEMKVMLNVLKQAIPLIPDYHENVRIQYDFTKSLYDFAFSEFPCLFHTLSIVFGNPYPKIDEMYTLFKEGKYRDGSSFLKYNHSLSLLLIPPEFFSFYEDHIHFIDLKSKLVLMQAVLEDKLGLTITAVDPFDGKPIRSIKKDDGKIIYYCLGHTGRDEKGTGINIFNCDTKLKTKIVEPQEK